MWGNRWMRSLWLDVGLLADDLPLLVHQELSFARQATELLFLWTSKENELERAEGDVESSCS